MTIHRIAALATAGALAVFGLAACGPAAATDSASAGSRSTDSGDAVAAFGVDGQALAALGLDPVDLPPVAGEPVAASAAPTPTASAEAGKRRPGPRNRLGGRHLRGNTLHGEIVVKTAEGTRTVVVQRGTITAIDDDSMTVRSTDGFSLTWTLTDRLHVLEHRRKVQPDQLKVGTEVGVAGAEDGGDTVARLVVIPIKR